MILCIELMLFSISLHFIFLSMYTYNDVGQVLALFIVTNAAAETAIGLSLLTVVFQLDTSQIYDVSDVPRLT